LFVLGLRLCTLYHTSHLTGDSELAFADDAIEQVIKADFPMDYISGWIFRTFSGNTIWAFNTPKHAEEALLLLDTEIPNLI